MCHAEKTGGEGAGGRKIYEKNAGTKGDGRTSTIFQDGVCHKDENYFWLCSASNIERHTFPSHESVHAAQ